ncbi:MAG: hypothetical protein HND50_09945 [Calditrichaeota bacterium]|nr:hypothetical protein [Calditrichota bacterium]
MEKIKNRFGLSEWSGAFGDLGTLLPLAFALVVFNGFGVSRLFLLWGAVYILSGWYFKVPLSVQPLKAMSVIAIGLGLSAEMLAGTSFFFGILLIILSATGAIRWLQKWFSPALVKGIQLGIGLILIQKAVQLVYEKGFLLNGNGPSLLINFALLAGILLLIGIMQFRKKISVSLILIAGSIILVSIFSNIEIPEAKSGLIDFKLPLWSILPDSLILLIIPQLPLTLGNAMFAASDTCHTFWPERSSKITPSRLGLSIGISDSIIGMLGGFPMCHGAGGIAAHRQFGAKTGGTTIIIGSILVILALISPLSSLLFLIPVPLLAAMLLFDSWRMILLIKKLQINIEIIVALLVGLISFTTRNISIALVIGLLIERGYNYFQQQKTKPETSL